VSNRRFPATHARNRPELDGYPSGKFLTVTDFGV
jgi:hypothetical protein